MVVLTILESQFVFWVGNTSRKKDPICKGDEENTVFSHIPDKLCTFCLLVVGGF